MNVVLRDSGCRWVNARRIQMKQRWCVFHLLIQPVYIPKLAPCDIIRFVQLLLRLNIKTLLLFQSVCRVHGTLPITLGWFYKEKHDCANIREEGSTVIKLIAQEQIRSFSGLSESSSVKGMIKTRVMFKTDVSFGFVVSVRALSRSSPPINEQHGRDERAFHRLNDVCKQTSFLSSAKAIFRYHLSHGADQQCLIRPGGCSSKTFQAL